MKTRILLLFTLLIVTINGFSQADNYQKIRFDFGIGYAVPFGDRFVSGFGFSPELKFNATNKLAIGFKFETYILSGNEHYLFEGAQLESAIKINNGVIIGFGLVGEYFLTESTVRPFLGVGLGFYAGASSAQKAEAALTALGDANISLKFGAFAGVGTSPSIGVQYKWLKFSLTYNAIFSSSDVSLVEEITTNGNTQTISTTKTESNDYLVIKFSFGIGGGKK